MILLICYLFGIPLCVLTPPICSELRQFLTSFRFSTISLRCQNYGFPQYSSLIMKRRISYLYKIITCSSNTTEEDSNFEEEQEINVCNNLSSAPGDSTRMTAALDSQPTSESDSVQINNCILPNTESLQEFVCSDSACLCRTIVETDSMMIKNDLDILLSNICPTNYYDFCVIACEADYERALEFRSKFCQKFELKGCMLYDPDIISFGADVFQKYEAMLDRSTKVLFFITENYKADNMFLRVQNGAVYQQLENAQKDREKCIPVFPDGNHGTGLAMLGIVGLDLALPLNFNNCVVATFNDQVRKVRILKEASCMKIRQELFSEIFHAIVKSSKTKGIDMHDLVKTKETLMLAKNILSSLPTKNNTEMLKHCSTQDNYETANTVINISGTASNIHVGPKIELNINVCCESSEDD